MRGSFENVETKTGRGAWFFSSSLEVDSLAGLLVPKSCECFEQHGGTGRES